MRIFWTNVLIALMTMMIYNHLIGSRHDVFSNIVVGVVGVIIVNSIFAPFFFNESDKKNEK